MTRYISLFSGIECASVAALPLGWEPICFSEIEPFPSVVLAHHYPDVPNVGDMTKHDWRQYRGKCDVVIGGSPCQAFSVAGRRGSLADDRGNLTLKFVEAIDDIEPIVTVWENVPGVLSTRDNAFGCFLAALAGAGEPLEPGPRPRSGGSSAHWTWEADARLHRPKWGSAGYVAGPGRAIAWRVLDAQYFGLAQRRARVFLVASPRSGGIDPAAVLFEFNGVRRDSPPRRRAPQDPTRTVAARPGGGGGLGADFDCAGGVPPVAGTLNNNGKAAGSATSQDADQGLILPVAPPLTGNHYGDHESREGLLVPQAFGGNNTSGPIDVSPALRAHPSPQFDFESDAFIAQSSDIAGTLTGSAAFAGPDENDAARGMYVAHTLRGDGFDASEDGSGRGTPLVAFTCKGHGDDAGELAPTLRSMTSDRSHANGGGQVAIAFHPTQDPISSADVAHALACGSSDGQCNVALALALRERDGANTPELGGPLANALRSATGGSDKPFVLAFQDRFRGDDGRGYDRPPEVATEHTGTLETVKRRHVACEWMVRRLTPRECERLQGLSDDYTLLTDWNGWRYVEDDEDLDDLRERGFQLRLTKKTRRWRVNDPDGPRYKAIGNGMAVPCIGWVLSRVDRALRVLREELSCL